MFLRVFKIAINTILFFLIALGIFVVFSFVPIPGNYKIFTVQSGSMEPAIRTGSMIFVKPMEDYQIDDVVTKKTDDPKVTVTHRITQKKEANGRIALKTKGDANNAEDLEETSKENVIGKVIFSLPFLGYAVSYARTAPGFILLVVIPAVIIIYDEIQNIQREMGKMLDRMREKKKIDENTDNKDQLEEKMKS